MRHDNYPASLGSVREYESHFTTTWPLAKPAFRCGSGTASKHARRIMRILADPTPVTPEGLDIGVLEAFLKSVKGGFSDKRQLQGR